MSKNGKSDFYLEPGRFARPVIMVITTVMALILSIALIGGLWFAVVKFVKWAWFF